MALLGITALAASLGPSQGLAGGAVTQPAGDASIALRWAFPAPADVSGYTLADSLDMARRFDLIVANPKIFRFVLPQMRAAHPSLRLLAYVNGAYVNPAIAADHPNWPYAHDASGRRVMSRKGGNYLMDVSSPIWRDTVSDLCRAELAVAPFDGCYLDMLGNATVSVGYVTSPPVDPATNAVWVRNDFLKATSALAARVASLNPTRIIVGNGLNNGSRYFDPDARTSGLLDGIAGANAESFVRFANGPIDRFRDEVDWKKEVDMVVDSGARARRSLFMTKVWVNATTAQVARWHRYALASFLLGTDGGQYFAFLDGNHGDKIPSGEWERAPLGAPLGPYAKQGGVYRRVFAHGLALVNPSTTAVAVPLGGTYHDLDGVAHTSITLDPNTGAVLTTG